MTSLALTLLIIIILTLNPMYYLVLLIFYLTLLGFVLLYLLEPLCLYIIAISF
jgi:hypothetical protein